MCRKRSGAGVSDHAGPRFNGRHGRWKKRRLMPGQASSRISVEGSGWQDQAASALYSVQARYRMPGLAGPAGLTGRQDEVTQWCWSQACAAGSVCRRVQSLFSGDRRVQLPRRRHRLPAERTAWILLPVAASLLAKRRCAGIRVHLSLTRRPGRVDHNKARLRHRLYLPMSPRLHRSRGAVDTMSRYPVASGSQKRQTGFSPRMLRRLQPLPKASPQKHQARSRPGALVPADLLPPGFRVHSRSPIVYHAPA